MAKVRLIDADALIKWIDDSVSQYEHTYSTDMLNMWGLFKDYLINNAPTVEIPKPVIIVRPCVALDANQYNELIKYLKEGYEKGLMIVPNYCEVKVAGIVDGVEVLHD